MKRHTLSHLSDDALIQSLKAVIARECCITADLLAHLAEVDSRKLYLPAGFPSMYFYCVRELGFSEQASYKRIQAARAARKFPAILSAVAEGRLHLSAVVRLAALLTPANADELLAVAERKTMAELELVLAHRFPRPDLPTRLKAIGPAVPTPGSGAAELSSRIVAAGSVPASEHLLHAAPAARPAVAAPAPAPAPQRPENSTPPRVMPLAPQRFALQVTVSQETHDLLRYAQALLGHEVPWGDVAQVLRNALQVYVNALEKRKFAKASRIRTACRRGSANSRYIAADVRRRVWVRDAGQCTFVSESGHRCPATSRLEFDHIQEHARGGQTSFDNLRLRCRAHNQYTAERTFGAGCMELKRERARGRGSSPSRTASRLCPD